MPVAEQGEMGSTARRGGEGVRYRAGRFPIGVTKELALIIVMVEDEINERKGRQCGGKRKSRGGDETCLRQAMQRGGVVNHTG